MVAITVVLAAVLYVMVSGFTHSPGTANSAGLNEAQATSKNWTVTISSVSASNIPLSNLKIVVNGTTWNWAAGGAFSSSGTGSSGNVASVTLTILSGNSNTYLSAGDYFTIVSSSTATALTGAAVTLYNGNSQLGTVSL